MKIPDFLKGRIAIIAVSLICTALGIAGYDFTIHEGQALGIEPQTEMAINSDSDFLAIKNTVGGLYQFRVTGDLFLTQRAVNKAYNAIPCGCETDVLTFYAVDQVVKLKHPLPLNQLINKVELPKALQGFAVKEWENVKVTFLGFAPKPPTSREKLQ